MLNSIIGFKELMNALNPIENQDAKIEVLEQMINEIKAERNDQLKVIGE
jgi:hypothetical protein